MTPGPPTTRRALLAGIAGTTAGLAGCNAIVSDSEPCAPLSLNPAPTDWGFSDHDAAATRHAATAAAPERPLTERWRRSLPRHSDDFHGPGPVVAANRIVLPWWGRANGSTVAQVRTYDLFTGTPGWDVTLGDWPNLPRPLLTEHRLLLDDGGGVRELDLADGSQRWHAVLPGEGAYSTGVLPYGKCLHGARSRRERSDQTTEIVATIGANGQICSETVVTARGHVTAGAVGHEQLYFGAFTEGSALHAYAPGRGEFAWRIQRGPNNGTEDIVAGPEQVYATWSLRGDQPGVVGAYDSTSGDVIWERTPHESYWPRSLALADGVLLIREESPDTPERIQARESATGDLRWSVEAATIHSPAIANGVVYVTLTDSGPGGSLALYDLHSGEQLAQHPMSTPLMGPIVASGHVLVVADSDDAHERGLIAFR